jgi:hypothetical protein
LQEHELNKEHVATILEHDGNQIIRDWMSLVDGNEELTAIRLLPLQRTGHLRLILDDLVRRLRLPATERALTSIAAREHGVLRRMQGYCVAMLVTESRMLQVSIFRTLQNNLPSVDVNTVLLDVMAIADEVDSQLEQAVLGFTQNKAATAASR